MLVFRIEVRMPPRLFSTIPLVYSGVGLRYFHTGFIPSGFMHLGKWLWRFYPLTLIRLDEASGRFEEALFSFCFAHQSVRGKRLFVTQPVTFVDVGYDGLKFFVESVEDFARGAFLEGIDVELHRPMGGYVSYPTSYSCISYDLGRVPCNHEVFVERLKLMGYEESVKVWTYGIDTLRYGDRMVSLEDVSPESISVLVQEGSFPYRSWALPTVDQGLEPSGDPFLAKAARKDGMTEAAFLVLPDLLEFVRKHGTPVPQLYQRALRGYAFSGLKVAKWVAKDADALLASLSKLIHSTGLGGLKRVEIAGVHDSLYDVKSALAEANFKPVCCTTILSKELA